MDTTELLGRIQERLEAAHRDRLRGVVLYGSEARGDAAPDSDIDVLVLLEGPIAYWDDLRANIEAVENQLPILDSVVEELHRRFDLLGGDWPSIE